MKTENGIPEDQITFYTSQPQQKRKYKLSKKQEMTQKQIRNIDRYVMLLALVLCKHNTIKVQQHPLIIKE